MNKRYEEKLRQLLDHAYEMGVLGISAKKNHDNVSAAFCNLIRKEYENDYLTFSCRKAEGKRPLNDNRILH